MPQIADPTGGGFDDASFVNAYGSVAPSSYGALSSGGVAAAAGSSSSSLLGLSGSQIAGAGAAIGDFSSALGDFASISSDNEAASAYAQAAAIAGQNIDITKTSTDVQVSQNQRKAALTYGQQGAAEAANGFAPNSGSGADIYRSSVEQAALASSLINEQGAVTENAYRNQQNSDLSMEAQAKAKASGAFLGGVGSTIAGVVSVAAMFA